MISYDIAIIGNGLAGAALACALKGSKLSIALIDTNPLQTDTVDTSDSRSIALNHTSIETIKNLALWDALKPFATPIHHVHISEKSKFGAVKLDAQKQDLDSLGHLVSINHLVQQLHLAISNQDNITFYCPDSLTNISIEQSNAILSLKNTTINTKLIIAADGANSFVRKHFGIQTEKTDYGQTAISCHVTLNKPHNNIAYERFIGTGAIGALPLRGNKCGIVWTVDSDQAENLLTLSDNEFVRTLQEDFGYRLGRFESVTRRRGFPLSMTLAQEQIRPHMVLLGNAAHSISPLAAQGFNLSLADTDILAMLLKNTSPEGIGNYSLLQQYLSQREKSQAATIQSTHQMANIYGRTGPLSKFIRRSLLNIFSVSPTSQQLITKMGAGKWTPTHDLEEQKQ